MTNKAKKSAPVKAGSNIRRSLDAIGADLLKRTDMFESGKLLDEAKRACEHGEFLPWLELYWPYSEDTAERHMAAYHLSTKFRTVRNMKVAPSTIYKLIDLDKKPDPDVPALIEALVEESKTAEKPLTIAAANRVIEHVRDRLRPRSPACDTLCPPRCRQHRRWWCLEKEGRGGA